MTKYRKAFAICCLLTIAGPVVAAEDATAPESSASYQNCRKLALASGIDSEMARCNVGETERQDRLLNAVYHQLMTKLEPGRRAKLQKMQRAWIDFRDAKCAYEEYDSGGTLGPVEYATCQLNETYNRRLKLAEYLKLGY